MAQTLSQCITQAAARLGYKFPYCLRFYFGPETNAAYVYIGFILFARTARGGSEPPSDGIMADVIIVREGEMKEKMGSFCKLTFNPSSPRFGPFFRLAFSRESNYE
jgi:hypothetical protein